MTDPIADLLTRIRNANQRKLRDLKVPSSRMKLSIVKLLNDEGFIQDWKLDESGKFPVIRIWLKYLDSGEPVIRRIQKESKPGLRLYVKARETKPVLGGQGIAILSTSKGVMTDRQSRKENIGGELLCTVW